LKRLLIILYIAFSTSFIGNALYHIIGSNIHKIYDLTFIQIISLVSFYLLLIILIYSFIGLFFIRTYFGIKNKKFSLNLFSDEEFNKLEIVKKVSGIAKISLISVIISVIWVSFICRDIK
jgi:hypothetical protein